MPSKPITFDDESTSELKASASTAIDPLSAPTTSFVIATARLIANTRSSTRRTAV